MNLILEDINLVVVMPFLNNVRVKGLYTDYDREEALPSIYRYILEHV